MADYGVISKITFPGTKDATNHTVFMGLYQGTIYRHDFHTKQGVVKPVIGQLWPRQMWHYNDKLAPTPSTWGVIYRYSHYSYGQYYPPIVLGQLWPRGDYVANGIKANG